MYDETVQIQLKVQTLFGSLCVVRFKNDKIQSIYTARKAMEFYYRFFFFEKYHFGTRGRIVISVSLDNIL